MDLKFALRSLSKNLGFTALAVLVMALGIGANTAVFSVVNAVLLKPLAYRNPDRIVTLSSLWKKSGGHGQVSAPDFHDWHDQSTAFAAMAYYDDDSTSVMAGSAAQYAHVAEVTPEFFQVFGVDPVEGRLFSREEKRPGGARAVSVSEYSTRGGISAKASRLRMPSCSRLLKRSESVLALMPASDFSS